ncbi:hypothetical protein TWF694_001403 [Orbilia ellipsospora]|uniref:RING-type domain-containing protein n=1 Tax=Orbilia ellipsospora TaxID=2528407 RepID=A0AAV9XUW3_9PEZI
MMKGELEPSPFLNPHVQAVFESQELTLSYPSFYLDHIPDRSQVMDFSLRCNFLECRIALEQTAVVTTCSHIFCSTCADNLLSKQATASHHLGAVTPTCPACRTELKNPDDIVKTNLNPTDDYKTSVLSGLSPELILEIASRGISFWVYQTTQEIVYQEYLSKTIKEKYNGLSTQHNNFIHEANSQFDSLTQKIQELTIQNETNVRKNHELGATLREKSRKLTQIQDKYDQMRRKSLVSSVQVAARNSINGGGNVAQFRAPGSSNGAARLSASAGMPVAPVHQNQHLRCDEGGQMSFTQDERLTIPSGNRSAGRREGSISDRHSESGRRNPMMPPKIPTHARTGGANAGPWNGGTTRENMGGIAAPHNAQNHRQPLRQFLSGHDTTNNRYTEDQNWNATQQKSNLGPGGTRGFGSQRQALNEMPANIGPNRARMGVENIQVPGTGLRPMSRQFVGTPGGTINNGIYLG